MISAEEWEHLTARKDKMNRINNKGSIVRKGRPCASRPSKLADVICNLYAEGCHSEQILKKINASGKNCVGKTTIEEAIRFSVKKVVGACNKALPRQYDSVRLMTFSFRTIDDGQLARDTACVILGTTLSGRVSILRVTITASIDSAFWASELDMLRQRGLRRINSIEQDDAVFAEPAIVRVYPGVAIVEAQSGDGRLSQAATRIRDQIDSAMQRRGIFSSERAALRVICVAVYQCMRTFVRFPSPLRVPRRATTTAAQRVVRSNAGNTHRIHSGVSATLVTLSCALLLPTSLRSDIFLEVDEHTAVYTFRHGPLQDWRLRNGITVSDELENKSTPPLAYETTKAGESDPTEHRNLGDHSINAPAYGYHQTGWAPDTATSSAHDVDNGRSWPSLTVSNLPSIYGSPVTPVFTAPSWVGPGNQGYRAASHSDQQDIFGDFSPALSPEPSSFMQSSLKTEFRNERIVNPGLNFDPSRRKSYWAMNFDSSIADGLLKAKFDLAQSSFGPDNPFDLENGEHRDVSLDLEGKVRGFSYGTNWRNTGKDFDPLKKKKNGKLNYDTEKWTNWLSFRKGDVALTTSYNINKNNVQLDPTKPRYQTETIKLTFQHTLLSWPYLGYSLNYGTGTRESYREPEKFRPFKSDVDSLTGVISYSTNKWDASFSSWHTNSVEKFGGNRDSTMLGHTVSASVYPGFGFGMSPTFTWSEERYEIDSSKTSNQSLGLSIWKKFNDNKIAFNAYTSYYSSRNPAWSYDTAGIFGQAGLTWKLNTASSRLSEAGFYVTHNKYDDRVYTASSSDKTAVWLTYRIKSPQTLFNARRVEDNFLSPFED